MTPARLGVAPGLVVLAGVAGALGSPAAALLSWLTGAGMVLLLVLLIIVVVAGAGRPGGGSGRRGGGHDIGRRRL